MNKSEDHLNTNAPGDRAHQGQIEQAASSPGKEEHYQTARERVPTDQERQNAGLSPGGAAPASGTATGNPADLEREERIRSRAYQLWEEDGRQDGHAEYYWHRAAQDLDREDAERQRSGSAGKGVGQSRT